MRTILTPLLASWAMLAQAQFVGPYALTPPAPGFYSVMDTMNFGNWTAIGQPSTPLYVNTPGAPNGLSLDTGMDIVGNTGVFYTQAAASGTVMFDYLIYGAGSGNFSWFNSGSNSPAGGVAYGDYLAFISGLLTNPTAASFSVAAGDYFGFTVSVPQPLPLAGQQRAVIIQNFVAPTNSAPFNLSFQISRGQLVLSWPQGVLQSADDVKGSYSDLTNAFSPYSVPLSRLRQFYRVRTP